MKYYVYVSDAKLDMLSEQVPLPLRQRIAGELKVDVQVFSLSLRKEQSTETRLAKLRLVEEYIDRNELAGTVDEPKPYFRGSMSMQWTERSIKGDAGKTSGVLFVGKTRKVRVGLGGSSYNMLGETRDTGMTSMSSGPNLVKMLRSLDSVLGVVLDQEAEETGDWNDPEKTLTKVYDLLDYSAGWPSKVEFLARQLLSGKIPKDIDHPFAARVLLGTPIYVALADEAG